MKSPLIARWLVLLALGACTAVSSKPLPVPDGPPAAGGPDAMVDAPPVGPDAGMPAADSGGGVESGVGVDVGPGCPVAMPDRCGGACVDLATDPLNCGQCGNRCESFQKCSIRRCTPAYQRTVTTPDVVGAGLRGAVSASGAMFVAGIFKGTVDFDPGPREEKVTALAGGDVFVSSFGPDGTYSWTRTVPSTGDEPWVGVVATSDGGLALHGFYRGMADFFPGQAGAQKMATVDEAYVLKLRADGTFGFLRTFPAMAYSAPYNLVSLADGGLAVVGPFAGAIDLGSGSQNAGASGAFAVKLAAAGSTVWGRTFLAKELPTNGVVATQAAGEGAQGAVWLAGSFAGRLDLDPGAGTVEQVAGVTQSLFAVKLDAAGNYAAGSAVAIGAREVTARDVAVGSDAAVYIGGNFAGGAIPQRPGATPMPIPNAGDNDAFVVKLRGDGQYDWGQAWGGTAYDYAWTLAAVPGGGVLVAGSFASPTIDFNPQGSSDRRDPSMGKLFVVQLGADRSYGGTLIVGPTAAPLVLRATKEGFSLLGTYTGSVDFNPRADAKDVITSTGVSLFVSRYLF